MVENHQTSKIMAKKQNLRQRCKTKEKKQPKANRQFREIEFFKLLNILRGIRVEIAFRKNILFKKLDLSQNSWELTKMK